MENKNNTQQVTFHLKPPKFMVGDIVYSHGFRCVVLSVYKFDIDYSYDLKVIDGEELGKICQEDIIGCSLTTERLKKNGWKLATKDVNRQNVYYKDGLRIDESVYTGDLHFVCNDICVRLKYVSDLQHILFSLGLNSEMEV